MVLAVDADDREDILLSVVTPVLNGRGFLARALESVRQAAGTGVRIEHIVVDGGSTDGTLGIIEHERSKPGSPIREVLTGPDAGQSDAIRQGFALARGRWLSWLNADDFFVPTGIETIAEALKRTEADVVLGRCHFVDAYGEVLFRPVPPEPVTAESLLLLTSGWYAGRSIVQPEAFVRRETYERVGGIRVDLHYSMDHEFWVRLALRGAVFESRDVHVARQQVHPGQKTASNDQVVREQLSWGRRVAEDAASSPGDNWDCVRAEFNQVQNKLDRYEAFVRAIDRIRRELATGVDVDPGADAAALARGAEISVRKPRVLTVGLTTDEREQVRSGFGVGGPVAVAGPAALPVSAFDVVVARWNRLGHAQGKRDLVRALRDRGVLVLFGEPDTQAVEELAAKVQQELANRLTWNQSDLVGPEADHRILNELQRASPLGAPAAAGEDGLVDSRFAMSKGSDHPLVRLAKRLGVEPPNRMWCSSVYRLR